MPLPGCRYTKLDQAAPYRHLASGCCGAAQGVIDLAGCVPLAAAKRQATNANFPGIESKIGWQCNGKQHSDPSSEFASIDIKEPNVTALQ